MLEDPANIRKSDLRIDTRRHRFIAVLAVVVLAGWVIAYSIAPYVAAVVSIKP